MSRFYSTSDSGSPVYQVYVFRVKQGILVQVKTISE